MDRYSFIDHLQDKKRECLTKLEDAIITALISKHPQCAYIFELTPALKARHYTTTDIYRLNNSTVNSLYSAFLNACRQVERAIDITPIV